MSLRRIIKLFKGGSVTVCGMKGRGKDMLFSNVIARRKQPYVSNLDYKVSSEYIPLDVEEHLDCLNDYKSLLSYPKRYISPIPEGSDIYISDGGIYFPSQYQGDLVKRYPTICTTMAISRHLWNGSVHINVQNLNRIWDKMREQSDIYIYCLRCFYFKPLKLVIQKVRIYEKADACMQRIPPFRVKIPLLAKQEVKNNIKLERERYYCSNGKIKECTLIYFNKSNYDTRYFKTLLGGDSNEE